MCCCGKPTRNDEPGAYSWDGKSRSTYGVEGRAPTLAAGHVLLYDGPRHMSRGPRAGRIDV